MKNTNRLQKEISVLKTNGYKLALAIATVAEVKAGAACGQLSIITQRK